MALPLADTLRRFGRRWRSPGQKTPANRPADAATHRVTGAAEIRELLLRFESLGHDCEFGLVQRHYGLEPMGLLRWNLVRHGDLVAALNARFAGVGEPEFTDLWFADDMSETFVVDKRWGLHMHTYKRPNAVNKATLLPQMCKRSAYLRDKLLEDLAEGQKTFIFQSPHIDLSGLTILDDAIKSCGNVRLLCVKVSDFDPSHAPLNGRPGEVFRIRPNLFVGFLGRRGNSDGAWNIAFDDWLTICSNVDNAPDLS